MGHNILLIFLLVVQLIAGCGQPPHPQPTSAAEPVPKTVVAGSGTNLPVTRELAKAFAADSGIAMNIPSSIGSGGAINAVLSGELALGLISRPLTPEERAKGLKELPYARVAIVFAANSSVPDDGVTAADVLAILAGTKKTWSNGSRIYVFVREKTDSSNQQLYDLLPGYRKVLFDAYRENRWQVIYTDAESAAAVGRTPGAFGLVDSTALVADPRRLKALAVEGVFPTKENNLNGRYSYVKDLAFVYKGELSGPGGAFVDFTFSPAGRQVIERMGAIPLRR